MRLIIDDKIPYIRDHAGQLGQCTYLPGGAISAADVRDADALIIRTRTRCDEALLSGSKVSFVATATIGYDHIDRAAMSRMGISWQNCPGCNATSVAQYVGCVIRAAQVEGIFRTERLVVGLIGAGHVGTATRRLLEARGHRVLLNDPPLQQAGTDGLVSLEEIAAEADVVSLHTPLTTSGPFPTYHLAGSDFFGSLRRSPLFINSSRGACMDTAAVLEALRQGKIRAAAIDTWEGEPHISTDLLHAAWIATPHIAGYSADGKANATRMALEAVARHFGISRRFDVAPPPLPEGFRYDPDDLRLKKEDADPSEPLRLYDPRRDSRRLKAAPHDFELLRGNYPLRREHD